MVFMNLYFYQFAATLQLPEDDPYYPWELRFLDQPDTMPRYMRAAKWCVIYLPNSTRGLDIHFPQEVR